MTNQEEKHSPKGGHCWLDEQRIDAIGMAIEDHGEGLIKCGEQPDKGKVSKMKTTKEILESEQLKQSEEDFVDKNDIDINTDEGSNEVDCYITGYIAAYREFANRSGNFAS